MEIITEICFIYFQVKTPKIQHIFGFICMQNLALTFRALIEGNSQFITYSTFQDETMNAAFISVKYINTKLLLKIFCLVYEWSQDFISFPACA